MKTMVSEGDTLDFIAPAGGVVGGVGVLIGAAFGIVVASAAAGETAVAKLRGEYDHAAEGGAGLDIAQGGLVYWDNANKRMTKTAAGNTKVGYATVAKAAADTSVRLRLVAAI